MVRRRHTRLKPDRRRLRMIPSAPVATPAVLVGDVNAVGGTTLLWHFNAVISLWNPVIAELEAEDGAGSGWLVPVSVSLNDSASL
jgi:hypothetical protein